MKKEMLDINKFPVVLSLDEIRMWISTIVLVGSLGSCRDHHSPVVFLFFSVNIFLFLYLC